MGTLILLLELHQYTEDDLSEKEHLPLHVVLHQMCYLHIRRFQNDGRVSAAAEEIGDSTPQAVREIREPGPADLPARETTIDVQAT